MASACLQTVVLTSGFTNHDLEAVLVSTDHSLPDLDVVVKYVKSENGEANV